MNRACKPVWNAGTKRCQAAAESARTGANIAPIAAKIDDGDSIEARRSVLPGAGREVTLTFGGVVKLKLEQGVIDTLIENGGAICADGGTLLLTARAVDDLVSIVIANNGFIRAQAGRYVRPSAA